MSITEKIQTLSKKEVTVLFWICMGLTNREIIKELDLNDKTLGSRITRIYEKLEIEGNDKEKRDLLLTGYCKIVKELVDGEKLKTWIPIRLTPEEENRYALIEFRNPDDLETIPEPKRPKQLPPPSQKGETIYYINKKDANRRLIRFVLIFSTIIGILILVIVFLWLRTPPEIALIPFRTPSQAPENTPILAAASLTIPTTAQTLTLTITPPPPTFTPSLTWTPTTIPTATSTITPSITPSATVTSAPPGTVLFEDNFDKTCPGDGWITEMTVGDPVCSQGRLTAISEAWLFVGNPQWKNYKIEFDKVATAYPQHVGVGIHVQDKNTMYLAYQDYFTYKWIWLKQGESVQWPDSEVRRDLGSVHVTIIVKDAHYTTSISASDGQIFPDTTMTDNKYPSGYVAINVTKYVSIDKFKIIALP